MTTAHVVLWNITGGLTHASPSFRREKFGNWTVMVPATVDTQLVVAIVSMEM
jgi:hypothetical protein